MHYVLSEFILPPAKPARYALAEEIGIDGVHLLRMLNESTAPDWLMEVPAVQVLQRVWEQQFYAPTADGQVRWRRAEDLPSAPELISSPYDPDARSSKKRETEWVGYKVHITETCDQDQPHLLTNIETTAATTAATTMTATIQAHVARRALVPKEHIVDTSYVSADHLLMSREHGSDLVGPVAADYSWQARANAGFGAASFVIDWDAQQARCRVPFG